MPADDGNLIGIQAIYLDLLGIRGLYLCQAADNIGGAGIEEFNQSDGFVIHREIRTDFVNNDDIHVSHRI